MKVKRKTVWQYPGGTLYLGDCLQVLPALPRESVDIVLADPPYGTTQCKWDSLIALDQLWLELERLLTDRATVVMTACQPFTTALISSKLGWFKWADVWDKVGTVGHLNAKRMPLRRHEDILIFAPGKVAYRPQMRKGKLVHKGGWKDREDQVYGKHAGEGYVNDLYYPTSIFQISSRSGKGSRLHPTQKPVELFKQLILNYSNPEQTVLDFCFGSGTTAIACLETGRQFIGIEKEAKYFHTAIKRIQGALCER